ncbi:phage antirepressor [Leuconostoc mesenteroides]|uniref:phage antirepressor n=1 Tax=Leuconostoc mesenteroides TaxID=1245 RepID=UPI0020733B9F|nr:phage antirepressor KilAC domain-containing protein [Leuconostoc mesenteroides]MCM6836095.1 phage antirepressor KilAC domain-containing protein [Leuconostoc mesenteroides]
MNEVEVFNFEANEVRTVLIENEVWFVGKDVAESLGYKDTVNAIKSHIDDEDKQIIQRWQNTTLEIPNRGLTLINQSGVISLTLSSKLPSARKFKRWVTSEVIPSVLKHGAYMTDEKIEQVLTDPDTIIRLATQLKEERLEKERLAEQVQLQAPKVEMAEKLLEADDANISMKDFAKLLANYGVDVGRNTLMKGLRNSGWLLRDNTPSAKAMSRRIFNTHETVINTSFGTRIQTVTTITPKGQEFLIKRVTREMDVA